MTIATVPAKLTRGYVCVHVMSWLLHAVMRTTALGLACSHLISMNSEQKYIVYLHSIHSVLIAAYDVDIGLVQIVVNRHSRA